MSNYSSNDVANAIAAAAKALDARKDEINRPEFSPCRMRRYGNEHVAHACHGRGKPCRVADRRFECRQASCHHHRAHGCTRKFRCHHLADPARFVRRLLDGHEDFDIDAIGDAFAKAVEVAFNAVRKPVEGTTLTVLRDTAEASVPRRRTAQASKNICRIS